MDMSFGRFTGSRLVCPVYASGLADCDAVSRQLLTSLSMSFLAVLGSSSCTIGERPRTAPSGSARGTTGLGGDELRSFEFDLTEVDSRRSSNDSLRGMCRWPGGREGRDSNSEVLSTWSSVCVCSSINVVRLSPRQCDRDCGCDGDTDIGTSTVSRRPIPSHGSYQRALRKSMSNSMRPPMGSCVGATGLRGSSKPDHRSCQDSSEMRGARENPSTVV